MKPTSKTSLVKNTTPEQSNSIAPEALKPPFSKIGRPLTPKEIDAIPEEAIDYSDISELDEDFWANARIVYPNQKELISIRLDKDILAWFRKQGKGYQTRINAVLRSFMEASV